ncbi:MAG: hypothetical protein E7214_02335 [Clostridium sp.]|nr:hypothetical protein [Clostridium sp.]
MNIKDKVIKAIKNDEFILLLEGKGEYKIELHQWIGANVPTDIETILTKGIYPLYISNPNIEIETLLEEALIDMMDREVFDLYCALSTIFSQLIEEEFQSAPFKIDRNTILSKLSDTLRKRENELKHYFEWEGQGKPEGMWSEVMRICNICNKRWNISIL